jgi:hypothetical protein
MWRKKDIFSLASTTKTLVATTVATTTTTTPFGV